MLKRNLNDNSNVLSLFSMSNDTGSKETKSLPSSSSQSKETERLIKTMQHDEGKNEAGKQEL
jgi:hypothetical protein